MHHAGGREAPENTQVRFESARDQLSNLIFASLFFIVLQHTMYILCAYMLLHFFYREWNLDNLQDEDCDFVQIKSMLTKEADFLG